MCSCVVKLYKIHQSPRTLSFVMLLIQLSPNPNPYLRKFLNCSAPFSIEFEVGAEEGVLWRWSTGQMSILGSGGEESQQLEKKSN